MKTCRDCSETKSLEEFHHSNQRKDGSWNHQNICKPCAKVKARQWYVANQERARQLGREKARALRADPVRGAEVRARERASKLLRKYGVTAADWERMYSEQDGRCAICRIPLAEVKACVDHDHTTGVVRGILCNECNHGLGKFSDSAENLTRAAAYLMQAAMTSVATATDRKEVVSRDG